jgi:RimJ/RimL family protein N-acetyltransferase
MLSGPRIRLRMLEPVHRDLYRSLYCSAEVMQTIAPPLAPEQADIQFQRVLRHNACDVPGHRVWAIEVHGDPNGIGLTALMRSGNRAEFGIMLRPNAWRSRFANETLSLLVPHALGEMGLDLIEVLRPDDSQATVVERMLVPFGFQRVRHDRAGWVRWQLPAGQWTARMCAGLG